MTEHDRPRSQRARMLAGEPYVASDPELQALSQRAMRLTERYNRTSIDEPDARRRILVDLLGAVGDRRQRVARGCGAFPPAPPL